MSYLIDKLVSQFRILSKLYKDDELVTYDGPYVNRDTAKIKIGNLLIRYSLIVNNLCEVLDEIRNPVLQEIAYKTYELTASRVLHLHYELSRLMSENVVNLDDLLIERNLTPFDMKLKLPYYLKIKRWKRSRNMDDWFEEYRNVQSEWDDEKNSLHIKVKFKDENDQPESCNEEIEGLCEAMKKDSVAKSNNYDVQQILKANYKEACTKTADNLKIKYQRKIEENIEDEIIDWIEMFFDKTGNFPTFPPNELIFATGEIHGGPKMIAKEMRSKFNPPLKVPNDIFSKEFACIPKLNGSELVVNNNWISPEDWIQCRNNKKGKDTNKQVKKLKVKEKNSGFMMEETDYFSIMNFFKLKQHETFDTDVENDIKLNAMVKIGSEIRAGVDEMMREELSLHNKVRKKKTKNKKKKVKTILSTEQCMQQLANSGVLKQPNKSHGMDIEGKIDKDIWDLLQKRCIFPLASCALHHFAPLTRSICLLGPQNSEKQLILDMLVNETASVLFDLSPIVTANIFPGKKQFKTLLSLVSRLARELQPSIIFVSDVDKIFYKQVPKYDKALNPTRLQAFLPKLIKNIEKMDKILVVTNATEPWLAKTKKITKTLDLFLYVPSSKYETHMLAWKKLLTECDMHNIAALAKITSKEGFQYHDIVQAVINSNKSDNVIDKLPISQTEVRNKFLKFIEKTPLAITKAKIGAAEKKKTKFKK